MQKNEWRNDLSPNGTKNEKFRLGVILITKLQDNVNKDGIYEPIVSKKLESLLGINGVGIREIVHELRKACYPICSGHKGYWYANSVEEIEETAGHLNYRAYSMLEVAKYLKQTASEWRESIEADKVGERRVVQSELCGVR